MSSEALFLPYLLVFGCVAVAAVALAVLAFVRGREPPTRRWAWITGLVLAVVGTAFHLLVALGATIASGQVTWLLLGSIALVSATVLAFVRPRWAAWIFAVTAVLVPLAITVVNAVVPDVAAEFPALVVVGFYSVRALITAAFLWVGSRPVTGGRPPASPSPVPRSESVPTG